MKRKIRLLPVLLFVLCFAACSDWEHQTYRSLAASKAVIDEAGTMYNAGQLPQTKPVYDLITHARQVQKAAVDAFASYAAAKLGGAPAATVAEQQAAVNATILQVQQVIADIQALTRKGK